VDCVLPADPEAPSHACGQHSVEREAQIAWK
jgi:hypothetical protein